MARRTHLLLVGPRGGEPAGARWNEAHQGNTDADGEADADADRTTVEGDAEA